MQSVESVLKTLPWYAWIPIVSIISGTFCSISKTFGKTVCFATKKLIDHHERMAMIRHGIHPDHVGAKPHEFSEV